MPTAAGEVLLRHVKALRLLEASTLRELNPAPDATAAVPLAIADCSCGKCPTGQLGNRP